MAETGETHVNARERHVDEKMADVPAYIFELGG